MNETSWVRKLDAIRQQLHEDFYATAAQIPMKKARVVSMLIDLEQSESLTPHETRVVQQLRHSVDDYYELKFNRAWALKFAITDIHKLECLRKEP